MRPLLAERPMLHTSEPNSLPRRLENHAALRRYLCRNACKGGDRELENLLAPVRNRTCNLRTVSDADVLAEMTACVFPGASSGESSQ